MSSVVKIFNANPWKQHIPDCTVRAVVMAIGMKYELVCEALGQECVPGRGLAHDDGISLHAVKQAFGPYFGAVVEFYGKPPPDIADEMKEVADVDTAGREICGASTLEEFVELYEGEGRFIVDLAKNPASNNPRWRTANNHLACVFCPTGRPGWALDTGDTSEMVVAGFMQVAKTIPKDDPRHWVYDAERKCFAGYGMENAG